MLLDFHPRVFLRNSLEARTPDVSVIPLSSLQSFQMIKLKSWSSSAVRRFITVTAEIRKRFFISNFGALCRLSFVVVVRIVQSTFRSFTIPHKQKSSSCVVGVCVHYLKFYLNLLLVRKLTSSLTSSKPIIYFTSQT